MFTFRLTPRYCETDALGHINNTVVPVWFEEARTPIFRIFMPGLGLGDWNLILKKLEVEYVRELFHGAEVEVRTWVSRLGGSSFTVSQEAFQRGELAAAGSATLIHFDFEARKPAPIPLGSGDGSRPRPVRRHRPEPEPLSAPCDGNPGRDSCS